MNKAVFLDRDGTINEERHYLFRQEDFVYRPGVAEGLRSLQEMGFLLVVITNQSGIARGYYTEDDYRALTDWMIRDLLSNGVRITAAYHCPHHPEGKIGKYAKRCECRKPKTGLFLRAAKELYIDLDRSYAIGDRLRDLSVTETAGTRGVWITDGTEENAAFDQEKIRTAKNFAEAVDIVTLWNSGGRRSL